MLTSSRRSVTVLLGGIRDGKDGAGVQLIDLVYDELRRVASNRMRQERADHTLQPTALVNEVLVQLLDQDALGDMRNRKYFFAASVRAMRRILVDHARHRNATKRGGDIDRIPLDDVLDDLSDQNLDMLDLDEALDELATRSERQAEIVMLRFFGGLTVPEIAKQVSVSVSTVESDFRIAKAWLRSRLGSGDHDA